MGDRPLVTHSALIVVAVAVGMMSPAPAGAQPAADFTPVTDAMLQDPAAEDWLTWRRTLDGWGYSPLAQIDRSNVGRLRMVWTRGLTQGSNQATPLVYDGTMYMPNPGDVIQAIDAVTGDLRWEYRREHPEDLSEFVTAMLSGINRNVAIYDNLIIDTSADDFVFAIDATTGELVWETEILDYRTLSAHQSSGGGLIFVGDAAGRFKALDQEDGDVLWEINLGSPLTGFPMTYAVDGRQYVAVSTGYSLNTSALRRLTPDIRSSSGNNLFVFALPD